MGSSFEIMKNSNKNSENITEWFNLSQDNDDNSEYESSLWTDMPEFVQEKKEDSYAKIIFRFENQNDLDDFSSLIGQKLTNKTKSTWFPFKKHRQDLNEKFFYVDDDISNET